MEQTLTKNYLPSKLGRNSLCPCDSGKKYKKCCLRLNTVESDDFLKQASINKLRDRNSGRNSIVADAEKLGVSKMSAVILEYADELFDLASSASGMKNAIFLAISTWNMSLMDEDKRPDAIDSFVYEVMGIEKNSNESEEMRNIVQALIEKRIMEYPSYNRIIIDYEFIQLNSRDFHLNVISSMSLD